MNARNIWVLSTMIGMLVSAVGCNTDSSDRPQARELGTIPTKTSKTAKPVEQSNLVGTAPPVQTSGGTVSMGGERVVAINGLNLSEAVGLAIARHPDISRADAVVARSASQVAIAQSDWYPTIQYGVQPGYGNYAGGTSRSSAVRGSIGIEQQLYDFGRTSSRISAASANMNKEKHLLADTTEQVAFDTAGVFIELSASQDMTQAAKRQVAALRDIRVKIAEREKAGLSDATDLNQADVSIQRAEAELLKQQTRFDVAAGKLAELIGSRPARVAKLSAVGKQVGGLKGGAGSVDQTPSLLAAGAAFDEANAKVKLAKAEQYPTIGVGVSQGLSTMKNDTNDNTWVGLSVNGSFSLGGKAKHQVEAAEADKRAASQTLESQRRNVRTALNSAKTEASGAYARAGSYEKVISLAQWSRDLFWQEYTLNKRPLTNVIDAESEIFQAELERSIAVADGILARVRSHVAVGEFVSMLRKHEGKAS